MICVRVGVFLAESNMISLRSMDSDNMISLRSTRSHVFDLRPWCGEWVCASLALVWGMGVCLSGLGVCESRHEVEMVSVCDWKSPG
jgi:hypothetical protein